MSSSSFLVGFAGSRSLPPSCAGAVATAVAAVGQAGGVVAVGCATGADSLALSAALAAGQPVCVFAAFGPAGAGSCSASSTALVLAAARAGVPVAWWSGGGPAVPLARRLSARSSALVAALAASPRRALIVFFSPGPCRGSARSARLAIAAGVPVFALACAGACLPALGAGAWVPVGRSGPFAAFSRWLPVA